MSETFGAAAALLNRDFVKAEAVFKKNPPDACVLFIAAQSFECGEVALPYLEKHLAPYFFSLCAARDNKIALRVYEKYPDCLTDDSVRLFFQNRDGDNKTTTWVLEDLADVATQETWVSFFERLTFKDSEYFTLCARSQLIDCEWRDPYQQEKAQEAFLGKAMTVPMDEYLLPQLPSQISRRLLKKSTDLVSKPSKSRSIL